MVKTILVCHTNFLTVSIDVPFEQLLTPYVLYRDTGTSNYRLRRV